MPEGQEQNWIQIVPGHGWSPIFRVYGPLDANYDKSGKLNDVERR